MSKFKYDVVTDHGNSYFEQTFDDPTAKLWDQFSVHMINEGSEKQGIYIIVNDGHVVGISSDMKYCFQGGDCVVCHN